MSIKYITQNKLADISEKEYGISLTPRQIKYFIDDNLLPKPKKRKSEKNKESKKTENFFNLAHTELMLKILQKYTDFGFRSVGSMKYVLGGGNFNIAEELDYLATLLKSGKIEENSMLVCYRCRFKLNGVSIKSTAIHALEEFSGRRKDDYPFFPNLGILGLYKKKDIYRADINRVFKNAYFWIKVLDTGSNIDIDRPSNFGTYYSEHKG